MTATQPPSSNPAGNPGSPGSPGTGGAPGGTGAPGTPEDRRARKARQTRNALATAALELILERGLADTTVEAISERADVTRRTFSRNFTGKEDAALDFVRGDGDRINALLRARPAAEPPLLAYRAAVRGWLADRTDPAWHDRPDMRRLLALLDREPALFAAYERVRVDAQEESIRIIAARLGTDDTQDVRPSVVVGAAAGVLTAALRQWARTAGDHATGAADLAALVERAYDALTTAAVTAAADRTTDK
ncbi:TetR family transcriptional regulator [Streptomyces sp. SAT1]|uniref:TetR/AcrR family transcriptional regulator n=1 Tax=Streptomyces sp. SAT1 TaxID=1849967 RepID=UPI0007DD5A66|nr:TetR/AcrR family transcriptional regulator [Streptomyces sp. SAT1]ANH94575.1 TetR family transcriptional regulator [Streptomyces sp. SAT1]